MSQCPRRVLPAVTAVFGDTYVDRSRHFDTPDFLVYAVATAERRRTFWQFQMLHCSVSACLLAYLTTGASAR